ncbi:3'5'-cyclic nucleotide phosphodiesterase [Pelomyxa schiedti]|nr:3'5'-cyclic nucleotide phosphodiesterase [Pelomyxa schiedti]
MKANTEKQSHPRCREVSIKVSVAVALVVITAVCVWGTWFASLQRSIDIMTAEEMKYASELIGNEIMSTFQILSTQTNILSASIVFDPESKGASGSEIYTQQASLIIAGKNHASIIAIPLHPETFDPYIGTRLVSETDIMLSLIFPFEDGTGNLLYMSRDNSTGGLLKGEIISPTSQDHVPVFLSDGNLSWTYLLEPPLNSSDGTVFSGPGFVSFFDSTSSMIFVEKVLFSPYGYPIGWVSSGAKTLLLSDMLSTIEFRDESFAYLVDSTGFIVCSMGSANISDEEVGAKKPTECNDTKIANSMRAIEHRVNTTSLSVSVYFAFTFKNTQYQIEVTPMYLHANTKWIRVIAISSQTYEEKANLSARLLLSIGITLGIGLILVGIAALSTVTLSRTQNTKPQAIDLDSGITKVIAALQDLREKSNKRSKKLIAEIILNLSQTTALFMPDLKNQEVLFDKDIQKWLDDEIAPRGFNEPKNPQSQPSSTTVSMKASQPKLGDMDLASLQFPLFDIPSEGILVNVSMQVLHELDVLTPLNIPPEEVKAYIDEIEHLYKPNDYHNTVHAADVVQCLYYLLIHGLWEVIGVTNYLDVFILIISGVVHDVGHPGVNNAFLIATENELALRYNDRSVLENFHASLAIKIFLSKYASRWNLPKEEIKQVRTGIINLVLATDVSQHFEIISKFKVLMANPKRDFKNNREHLSQLLAIAIKTADISNVMRPHTLMQQWVKNLTMEFFSQGDQEQEQGVAPSPFTDRSCGTAKLAKLQTNFVKLVAQPLATVLDLACPVPDLLLNLEDTHDFWSTNPVMDLV